MADATPDEPIICAHPGCDLVVESPADHRGPPLRYCENPEHNAHSTYHALRRGEGEVPPDTAERIFGKQSDQGA
jgi:hypothetical protein